MSKQDIEKRLGFAAQGVKETTRTSAKKASTDFDLEEACWEGYEAVGTKKKDGKTVPNCVPKKKAARPGAKAKMALTIYTVGVKNACYEALSNLKALAQLASETNSGWDFHVNVMTDHVKSAMSKLESSPAQAGEYLSRAIDTLGMLRKIDPVRLNDIQKGSLKQLIGYVAKSLRDARANIKVVTTASRPGAKAEFAAHPSWSEGILGKDTDPKLAAYSWISKNNIETGRKQMLLADLAADMYEKNPSMSIAQAVLAAAKDMVRKGVATRDIQQWAENSGKFARPGVKATFGLRVPELETMYSSLGASGQAITDKPSARKDRALLLKLDAEYSQPTDTVMVALNAAKLYRQLSAGSKATPQGQRFQQRLEIAGGHRFARPGSKAKA